MLLKDATGKAVGGIARCFGYSIIRPIPRDQSCSREALRCRFDRLQIDAALAELRSQTGSYKPTQCAYGKTAGQNIIQSINIFNVLRGHWDPTDKKFSSVNSYRQDLLPTCKAFPKETTTCIWFTKHHKVCNSTTVLQDF